MCGGCWKEYELAQVDSAPVRYAAGLVRAAMEGSSPAFHVIIEDWNIEDEHFDDPRQADLHLSEREAFAALKTLTVEERASALALAEGFWKPDPD